MQLSALTVGFNQRRQLISKCIQHSEGNFKFVTDPARIEAETGLRLKLRHKGMLDQLGAEATTRWFLDRGSTLFGPNQQEAGAVAWHRRIDVHPSRRARECPIFYGIRAQFIEHHGEGKCGRWRHIDIGASHRYLRCHGRDKGLNART